MRTDAKPRQRRLPRNTLTRELIVQAAIEILDDASSDGLTFQQLGRSLGCTPPAMYRHFASREEVLAAVTDELIREAFVGFGPSEDWQETLRDVAERTWSMGTRHPAAAALSLFLPTGGTSELAVVNAILEAVMRAGWSGERAVLEYRAFADFMLAVTISHASQVVAARTAGRTPLWPQNYTIEDPTAYASIAMVRVELRDVDLREILDLQIESYLFAMAARAPAVLRR